jgi:hypothetical protein
MKMFEKIFRPHCSIYTSSTLRPSQAVRPSIQPDKFIVASSPISPGKFLIPKSSVRGYEAGTIYLDEDLTSVTNNYQFE